MFELGVPFFLPVWRRVSVVAIAIGWGLFELWKGEPFWAIIFIGMGGFAAWKFWTTDWSAVAAMDKDP
ncbi:hypothetical protein [Parasulfitobacter algicola]|uniref:Uncharacterized protein n=1 Tax=Parasulfitobacter algicola TaxID=2614809 RepID=A0ABX2ILA9_9RHOB|nr:hypothetical protein [Sulfitobacter algicola]NSX53658.1 hypothetical protein [Sulfitobacter algicola]